MHTRRVSKVSLRLRIGVALLTMYIAWGTTYIAIAYSIETMPDTLAMGIRFLTASLIQFIALVATSGVGQFRVTRVQLRNSFLLGAIMLSVGIGTVSVAEHVVPVAIASLLVAAMPVWTAVLRIIARDRPRPATLAGIVIGFAGLLVILQPGRVAPRAGTGSVLLWMLVILAGCLLWAIGSFLTPRIDTPARPLVLTTYEMLAAGVVLVLVGALRGQTLGDFLDGSARSWAGWWYLVLIGSVVGYTTYTFLLANAPISLVATYSYVNPVVATALAVVLFDETITLALLAGGAAIVVSVAIVASSERVRPVTPAAPSP